MSQRFDYTATFKECGVFDARTGELQMRGIDNSQWLDEADRVYRLDERYNCDDYLLIEMCGCDPRCACPSDGDCENADCVEDAG